MRSSTALIVVFSLGIQSYIALVDAAPAIQAVVGDGHCLVLLEDGTVSAFGSNQYGQILVPSGLSGVQQIAAGYYHNVALLRDGTLRMWGRNDDGQTSGAGIGGRRVRQVAAGGSQTVALMEDGSVVVFGNNGYGQRNVPAGLTGVRSVASGDATVFALRNDGTVVAWGDSSAQMTSVGSLSRVQQIDGGYKHAVVLLEDGSVRGWGNNDWGGLNFRNNYPGGVKHISAGAFYTFILLNNGSLQYFGGGAEYRAPDRQALAGLTFTSVDTGSWHSIAIVEDGSIRSWGCTELTPDVCDQAKLDLIQVPPNLLRPQRTSSTTTTTTTTTIISPTPQSGPTVAAVTENPEGSGPPIGVIVGGILGALAIVIAAVLLFLWTRKKQAAGTLVTEPSEKVTFVSEAPASDQKVIVSQMTSSSSVVTAWADDNLAPSNYPTMPTEAIAALPAAPARLSVVPLAPTSPSSPPIARASIPHSQTAVTRSAPSMPSKSMDPAVLARIQQRFLQPPAPVIPVVETAKPEKDYEQGTTTPGMTIDVSKLNE